MTMRLTRALKRASVVTTTMAALGAGALTLAPTAGATSWNIDKWPSFWQPCGTYMCLYYSPNLDNASWTPTSTSDKDLGGNKFGNHGTGSAGAGQVVRNNAASMGNNTTLRNNEASIRVDSCS